MSLLKRAMDEARSEEEIAAARAIAALSEDPQDAAQMDHFSTDPLTGFDAAQIAQRLFEGRRLEEFSGFLKEKNISPNIVLPNGLTLLQNSLLRFPQDEERLECLLSLGANPNLFMRRIEEEGFGSSAHRATYHPLNYAFANYPQLTTPEVCRVLRKYGASAEGLRNYFEVDPVSAVPDDETKAKLRRELIATTPDPELTKNTRQDVDLSVMQKHLANIEMQLSAAGFQVVNYVPPKKVNRRVAQPDTMIPIFENYRIITNREINSAWQGNNEAKTLLDYQGNCSAGGLNQALFNGQLKETTRIHLTSPDALELFAWLPDGSGAGLGQQNQTIASLKSDKFIIIKALGQSDGNYTIVSVLKDKAGQQFFFDPAINGVRLLSNDNRNASLADRSDIFEGLTASIGYLSIQPDNGELSAQVRESKLEPSNRPLGVAPSVGTTTPAP